MEADNNGLTMFDFVFSLLKKASLLFTNSNLRSSCKADPGVPVCNCLFVYLLTKDL